MSELRPTVLEAAAALRAGATTSTALTAQVLARADALDPRLGAFQARFDESALGAAGEADAELAAGVDRGPLHGIPIGIKDIIATAEGQTTAGSLVLDREWGRGRDAPVVTRLREAGAVIAGKLTTMEFAIGVPDPSKPFPVPRNPWDLGAWAGGSSSGAGNGVGAGLVLAALGTDTGGSIRIPSAFCGLSGLVPTFGRVPKAGCVPLGYTLDHIGPIATSARDCAALLGVIAGYDPSDPSSVRRAVPDYAGALRGSLEGVRIGVDREHHFPEASDPALAPCFDAALAAMEALGASISEVSLPCYEQMLVANIVTIASESLAYHRRDLESRWEDYFAGTRNIFAQGAFITGADYVQAQRARRYAQRELAALFAHVDVVVSPTTAIGAIPYDAFDGTRSSELDALFQDLGSLFGLFFTPYWDCLGNPVLAAPIGFNAAGLPLSMQIAGRPFEEQAVLDVGAAYQSVTQWHEALPPLLQELEPQPCGEPQSGSQRRPHEARGEL
ncbi:MAG TPA: amidase [Solirubrobacteraceae bacterium]|nr:amidase [Solirubrobacteraceae bacterium]